MPIGPYWDGLSRGSTNRANAYCIGISHAGCECCNPVLFYLFFSIYEYPCINLYASAFPGWLQVARITLGCYELHFFLGGGRFCETNLPIRSPPPPHFRVVPASLLVVIKHGCHVDSCSYHQPQGGCFSYSWHILEGCAMPPTLLKGSNITRIECLLISYHLKC